MCLHNCSKWAGLLRHTVVTTTNQDILGGGGGGRGGGNISTPIVLIATPGLPSLSAAVYKSVPH